ncbi:lipoyl(octanoyl) transferase [Malassezia vespertilionis]|uniref:lipoyl(octanoyl) transferase n=1 Tax=Malassezia vespertilionis TaxID=2020962 RepID=A0A2N1JFA5_9BASI|nr:lipoyl(octanoyl) transferase [Malassezia vespertilionis]PKI85232.1 hypothetical protein MVES_000791 [Malassezia vespertilionis]WFD05514.1 lipoyl(octanoyl) transferase [Malassezia vespertilionis]
MFASRIFHAAKFGTPSIVRQPLCVSHIPYYLPYELGLQLQEHLVQRRLSARGELRKAGVKLSAAAPSEPLSRDLKHAHEIATMDIMLLLQHLPVFTYGRRSDPQAEPGVQHTLPAQVIQTRRGGLMTYHGPGQLIGYPIVDVGAMQVSAQCYVAWLQRALRNTLAANPLCISTQDPPTVEPKYAGVWINSKSKIGSIGVHIRHRLTSHGFSLNVHEDSLSGFKKITACGLSDVRMTCIDEQVLQSGRIPDVPLSKVAELAAAEFGNALGRKIVPVDDSLITYVPSVNEHGQQYVDHILVDGHKIVPAL